MAWGDKHDVKGPFGSTGGKATEKLNGDYQVTNSFGLPVANVSQSITGHVTVTDSHGNKGSAGHGSARSVATSQSAVSSALRGASGSSSSSSTAQSDSSSAGNWGYEVPSYYGSSTSFGDTDWFWVAIAGLFVILLIWAIVSFAGCVSRFRAEQERPGLHHYKQENVILGTNSGMLPKPALASSDYQQRIKGNRSIVLNSGARWYRSNAELVEAIRSGDAGSEWQVDTYLVRGSAYKTNLLTLGSALGYLWISQDTGIRRILQRFDNASDYETAYGFDKAGNLVGSYCVYGYVSDQYGNQHRRLFCHGKILALYIGDDPSNNTKVLQGVLISVPEP
jgi:hypothetical protein